MKVRTIFTQFGLSFGLSKKMISKSELNSEFSFDELWGRVQLLTGWKNYVDLSEYIGITQQSVSGAKKRGFFPIEWAYKVARGYKGSTDWILTGNGSMRLGDAAPTQQQQPPQPQPLPAKGGDQSPYAAFDSLGVVEGMGMLTSIYGSGDTIYIRAINANLMAFSDAINMKNTNKDMQIQINTLENRIAELEQKYEKLLETHQQQASKAA